MTHRCGPHFATQEDHRLSITANITRVGASNLYEKQSIMARCFAASQAERAETLLRILPIRHVRLLDLRTAARSDPKSGKS